MSQLTFPAVAVMLPLSVMWKPKSSLVQFENVTVLPLIVPQVLKSAAERSAWPAFAAARGATAPRPESPSAADASASANPNTATPLSMLALELKLAASPRLVCAEAAAALSVEVGACGAP